MNWSYFADFIDSVDYKENVDFFKVYREQVGDNIHPLNVREGYELVIAFGRDCEGNIIEGLQVDEKACFIPNDMDVAYFVTVDKDDEDTKKYVLGRYGYYKYLAGYYTLAGMSGIWTKSIQAPGRIYTQGVNLFAHGVDFENDELLLCMGMIGDEYIVPEYDKSCFYSEKPLRRVEYMCCRKNMYNNVKIAKERIEEINRVWGLALV